MHGMDWSVASKLPLCDWWVVINQELHPTQHTATLWKGNMEPENDGLEDDFPAESFLLA